MRATAFGEIPPLQERAMPAIASGANFALVGAGPARDEAFPVRPGRGQGPRLQGQFRFRRQPPVDRRFSFHRQELVGG